MSGAAKIWPLLDNQRLAVDPRDTVWLSASAGTGKTQVLSSRVLRLLLQPGVEPGQILCLTFTKAGATEMAARINQTLARWVREDPVGLAVELKAIGADIGPAEQERARTLFAAVLDCPGGGLRIDTIHAFAQWLLAAFPGEAGLVPGTRPMEDRDRDLLARQVLGDLLLDAEERGNSSLLDAVAGLSLRMGADQVEAWLQRCASARELWTGPGSWNPPFRDRVNLLLGLERNASEASVAALCADDRFDVAALRRCLAASRAWKAATGQKAANVIEHWLSRTPAQRLEEFDALAEVFLTKSGAPRASGSLEKLDPGYSEYCDCVIAAIAEVRAQKALVALASWLTPALEVGRTFALAWEEAKLREGLIDFDDQIRRAAELLGRSELAEWIRYKLDRRFDHVLIDEAQDTNAAQWRIIRALTGEFFAGESAHGDKSRTLFVVGDYKQAIFRFQGTSPENFEAAKRLVKSEIDALRGNAELARSNFRLPTWQDLGLATSFRTSQMVLDFINRAIDDIGHRAFGLPAPPEAHRGDEGRPGYVVLWRPVGLPVGEDEDPEENEEGPETWLSRPDRDLAEKIARQVRVWMDEGFPLVKGGARRATPGDVMVLVRKRKELAGLIVARLHAAGVPVAGVDRLRLGAPLAVKDLVAALRFAAQPLDDLNLAALLVSPLLGWSQEQLLEHGYRDKHERLWSHLRRSSHRDVTVALAKLTDLLARADYGLPQALLQWVLVGPWQGREKLIARLGREANDPIDELLNAATAYASGTTASLVGFLAWFDAGEGELKRETGKSDDQVRVMTVHGSKGLQAPIVILADATGDPAAARSASIDLVEPVLIPGDEPRSVPIPGLRKDEKAGRILESEAAAVKAEMEEHWRLLYVAMTRAEEALFVGGALGSREKEPALDSWYARLAGLFEADRRKEDPLWGWRQEHGSLSAVPPRVVRTDQAPSTALPAWLTAAPPAEPRPPRPLAPSSTSEDLSPTSPLGPGASIEAARRGVLIHQLLERLPAVAPSQRSDAALRWLARNARMDGGAQREVLAAVLAVLDNPAWTDLFSPAALAEVPIAAVVGGQVVAGTIDRLLIEPARIRLIDFKTTRRPPLGIEEVPPSTLRQMAAYSAALEVTYPGREITAAIMYTQTPRLIPVLPERMEVYKAALFETQ